MKTINSDSWGITTPLDKLPFLANKELNFSSVAEMLLVRAGEIPDKPYIYFYDQTITYSQVNERSNRVANFLKSKGIKKGDIISQLVLNSPENYYIMFGTQKIGAIAASLNYMLQGPEIAYQLDDSKPGVVFVGSEFMEAFAAGYEQAKHKPLVVEVPTEKKHNIDLKQLIFSEILENSSTEETYVKQELADPFMLLYSSGTTGKPKGILLKNEGQLAVCKDAATIGLITSENDIMLLVMPLFHTNPICVWSYPFIYCGLTLCVRKGFSPDDFWPPVLDYGVTITMGVPAMYSYVITKADPDKIDRSRLKLKFSFSGAAPMPLAVINQFKDKFNVEIIEGYGLTEGTGLSTVNPPVGKRKPNSIGIAIPRVEIKIMDDNNKELPRGEKGEICTKGPHNMLEYLNLPDATDETILDGWMHTGDIAYMDDEGYIFIVDRKKDMINRGGENIYPQEVEMAIKSSPLVHEAAVIGVPHPSLGETVKAYVILREPGTMTSEELTAFLKDKIAKYKIPSEVEFVTDIPMTSTGKIMKKELREIDLKKRKS